jgi:beta-galactosidase
VKPGLKSEDGGGYAAALEVSRGVISTEGKASFRLPGTIAIPMQYRALILPVASLLCLLLLVLPFPLFAQPPAQAMGREKTLLGGDWRFAPQASGAEKPKFDDHAWQPITVPHTWNSKTNSQKHKAAWYRTHVMLTDADKGREIFLSFEGAATVADVYWNGVHLGQHRGAYTRFIFDATKAAHVGGDNILAVKCDTDPKDTADCLPAGNGYQLYHVYGGLYRRVWLLKTEKVHIDPTDSAASGVYLTPKSVTALSADLEIKTLVRNDSPETKTITVTDAVQDAGDHVVTTVSGSLTLKPKTGGILLLTPPLTRPHLWSVSDPYLYHVTSATAVEGRVTDTVTERTGFRFFQMTAAGFFLNGVNTPLRGVAKHQETEEHATAVTPDDLRQDWDSLQELGVNFVRLAHYPHAELEYDLADEKGIVVWAENGHSNPAAPTDTGDKITEEMVKQNYNHPSICFWSIGNEALGKLSDIATLEHYAQTVRSCDSTRLVTYASNTAFHTDPDLDFVAVNRYLGWYGGYIASFDAHAVYYHWISETGAGGSISTHTASYLPQHGINVYEPEEYQQEVAEARCQTVFRDHSAEVPLFTWWTFRDFGDPRYKGVNAKGLETYGGFKKDIYYLFQTFLKPATPLVHLCGKPWFLRRTRSPFDILTIKAYANVPTLTLTVNGESLGPLKNGAYYLPVGIRADNVFSWEVTLKPGRNTVTVDDSAGHTDSAVLFTDGSDPDGLVQNLTSSSPTNTATFIDAPIQAEWPFYDDFDGTGDNTFHLIPDILQGARWITMSRPSKTLNQTSLTFTIAPNAGDTDVFLMFTASPAPPPAFLQGFTNTGVVGTWRDNALNLVPYALYRRTVSGGTTVHIPSAALDYVVLVKGKAGAGESIPRP